MILREERSEDRVLELTLNRPEKLNALNVPILEALRAAQAKALEDPEVRAIVLRGAGPTFCAGADLEHIEAMHADRATSRTYLNLLREVIVGFERMPQPVIGALHGHVLAGGLELALGCDILIAARSCRIGDQHMRRGFIPGGGNTQRIPRLVGPLRAMDLLLTGRWLDATEACQIGLVSRVADDGEEVTLAREIAVELAAKSPQAVREVKRLTRLATEAPLADGLQAEIESVMAYYPSPDFTAALRTFFDRAR
jgi:enoyl-CoA hydratase/carnithine racemase